MSNAQDTPAGSGGQDTPAGSGGQDTQAGGGGGDPWFSKPEFGFSQEDKDYLAPKNYASPAEMLKAKRNFETLARDRNAISLPAADKLMEWDGFEKLGLPKDIKDYGVKLDALPENVRGHWSGLIQTLTPAMHAAKVLPPQAQAVTDALIGFATSFVDNAAKNADAERKKLETALREEWKGDFDKNRELSRRALAHFFPQAQADALEEILGMPEFVKGFHAIGALMAEDQLMSGTTGGSAQTAETARAERKTLEADPKFMASLGNPLDPAHAINTQRRNALLEIEAKQARAA